MKKTWIFLICALMMLFCCNMVCTAAVLEEQPAETLSGIEGEFLSFESIDMYPSIFPHASYSKGDLIYSYTSRSELMGNIPANKSKLSKLGFASDYKRFTYDYKYYKNGTLKTTSRDTYYAPMKDTYLIVYYKD